ncbi:MAG TPA: hypothetical protein PK530_16075 [Anaerolineales bacterium]|nr:hypothetical protein [Anaerolineales bacterium]
MTVHNHEMDKVLLEEELARALILSHWIAYATTGPDGVIDLTSENFWALQSDPTISSIGCTLPEVLWEFVGLEKVLEEILAGTRAVFRLNRIVRTMLDDQPQYINLQVVALSEMDPGRGLLLIIEDITTVGQLEQAVTQERNQLLLTKATLMETNQKLTRLSKYKTAVVSMAAQDIHTALTAAYEFAERIMSSVSQDDIHKNARAIMFQSQYALQLIKDLVELDQIERGVSSLQFVRCDLYALLEDVLETMQPIAESRQQSLFLIPSENTVTLQVDELRLRQALFRLLSTAIHFSPAETNIHCSILMQEQKALFSRQFAIIQVSAESNYAVETSLFPANSTLVTWDTSKEDSNMMAEWFLARRFVEVQGGHAVISVNQGVVFAVYIPLQ